MAEESDDAKRDELIVMRLISEGKNQVNELTETLDWTRERVEDTVDDLRENKYVQQVEDGGDQVLKVTDQGLNQVPKLARDVVDDTREFVDSVMDSFQNRFNQVLPKIDIDINVRKPQKAEE